MKMPLKAIILGTAFLGMGASTAFPFDFRENVSQCIADVQPQCFDPLFTELSERVALLSDVQLRDSYAQIPAEILLGAGMPKRAEEMLEMIGEPTKRKEFLGYIGNAYALSGQIDDAYRVLGEIDDPQARAIIISSIATFELRDADVDTTMAPMVKLMDPEFVDPIFAEIASELINNGQLNKASRIAEFIFDESMQALPLGRISREYASTGDFSKAVSYLNLIRDPDFKVVAWGDVGFTLHERGYETEAKQLYDEAAALATGRESDDPAKDQELESIAHYLIKSDQADAAMRIIELVRKPETRGYLYYRLGSHYADACEIATALEYYDFAVSAATIGDDRYRQDETLSQIAIGLAKAGKVDTALSTAQKVQEPIVKGAALKSIGDAVFEKRDITRAEEIYRSIDHPDLRAVALIGFSKLLDLEGESEKAYAVLTRLEAALADASIESSGVPDGNYFRGLSFSTLSEAFVERGDLTGGLRVALKIEDAEQRLWALVPVYGKAVQVGDGEFADKIVDILFVELEGQSNPGNVLSVLTYIVALPQNLQNIELHKNYARILKDSRSKSLLFSRIFENLTISGNLTLANQILELIPEESFRDVAIIELLKRKIELITIAN